VDGKPNLEDRAVRMRWAKADYAGMCGDKRANDCQAEPCASLLASSSRVLAREPPEHELSICARDSRPRVLDRQDHLVSFAAH